MKQQSSEKQPWHATDLGLHAVEGVAEYQAALQRAAPADFDAEQFSVLTVGSELQRRKWGRWKP